MKATIKAKTGRVYAARLVKDPICNATGGEVALRITLNAERKTINIYAGGHFGSDLTPEQACDLANTLSTWAKTGRIECED